MDKIEPKWKIILVYYSDTDNKLAYKTAESYEFSVNRNSSMLDIKKNFQRFLKNQQLALEMCFGTDIALKIAEYMPQIEFSILNSLYVHQHLSLSYPTSVDYISKRALIDDKMTLSELCGHLRTEIRRSPTNELYLRLRTMPLKLTRKLLLN